MRSRRVVWLGIAVLGLVFCGLGLGLVPGLATLLPRHVALAQGIYLRATYIDDDFDLGTGVPDVAYIGPTLSKEFSAWAVYSDMSAYALQAAQSVTWELDGTLGTLTYNTGEQWATFTAGATPGSVLLKAYAAVSAENDPSVPPGDIPDYDDLVIEIVNPVSSVNFEFPMPAAPNIYVAQPPGENTTFLPLRAMTDEPLGTDRVEFALGMLGSDDTVPYWGAFPQINAASEGYQTIAAQAYSVLDPGTIADTDQVDIYVSGVPDGDGNGIPQMGSINTPFMVQTPGAYVAQVPSADEFRAFLVKTYIGIGSAGSGTADPVNIATGSNIFVEVPAAAVPASDARVIVRSAELPEDLSDGLAALEIPTGEGVQVLKAIDIQMVLSDGSEVQSLAAPITVRIPMPPSMRALGIPIFAAETNLDANYDIEVPIGTTFNQVPIHYDIVNNEYVFEVTELTTYVPIYHPAAPRIILIDPIEGPVTGGTPVTINASGYLDDNLTVTFDDVPATDVVVSFNTMELFGTITCVTPPGAAPGPVDVRVTNPPVGEDGYALYDEIPNGFTYTAVAPPPVASFTWSQLPGTLTIQFTDTSTGQITNWGWTFGDGGGSFFQNPSHTYASTGTYSVTLTVVGPGGMDTDTQLVRVREPSELRKRGGAGGPCFVATAAYGTPMADQIDVLRSFRDRYLLTNAVGTGIVKAYYRYSPAMANAIADNATLRAITRAVLALVIAPLWMKLVAVAGVATGAVTFARRRRLA